ncbi:eukaryotic translation initiation factor 3 subunit A [Orbilia ellipsospora]|uniref:Eukaryotic translation initiation factor 3 subunit A n=1 Tax=Orbilia ellipsospora TaxID=2528407 RepID=A0AAV9XQ36_9PEZI
MPPVPHAKPENVLKRAQELIAVNQSPAALQILHEHITSKRSRNTPIASLEPVILLFIDLCVDLRKGKTAKDGLYQYKNIAQNTTVQTIEMVLRIFIEKSEAKVTAAQKEAEQTTVENVDDLEATETPESILMATVSGEQTKDRTDRKYVTPWLKFLWETYRTILDILRNNARLETMYQQTASQAFQFCLKYTRKTEFRRLCELLRNHLQNASKYSAQMHAINLNDPDTLQRHLDTRFQQLNAAVELELWQEAFRSIEDIHNLLTLSKRPAKPIMMANYYEKLTRIFRTSENHLFHAAAWNRYYNLLRSSAAAVQAGSVTKKEYPVTNDAEFSRVSSFVILSALSIPVISTARSRGGLTDVEEANKRTRSSRLTNLLGLTNAPTRTGLFKDILAKGLLKRARPEIRDLYTILEVDFHPLSICKKIAPILTQIGNDEDMKKYVPPLQQVILTRLFQQLSQVYDTVQLDFVYKLVTFPAPFEIEANTIEKFIMNGCKKGDLAIRVDHASGALTFESDVFSSAKSLPIGATNATEKDMGVQRLQSTPQEIVRTQLSRLAKSLYLTCCYVDPSFVEQKNREKAEALARAEVGAKKEHEDTLKRREVIEQRKEAAENAAANLQKEESRLRALRDRHREEAEQLRLDEEKKKRDLERQEKERERILVVEFWKQVTSMGLTEAEFRTQVKEIGLEIPENVSTLDSNFIRKVKIAMMEKEKKETNEKLRVTSKRIDHLERAYRKEELALLPQDYEAQRKRDLDAHNEKVEQFLLEHKQKHEENVLLKKRLSRLVPIYESFRDDVRSRRHEEFENRRKKAEQQLQVEMDKRRKQVREARERKRREEEEAERRRIEEEERLAKEEEERIAKEEEEARKKEEARKEQEERRKEREEAAAMQRERERIAEERAEERKRQRREAEIAARERPAPPKEEPAKTDSEFRPTRVPIVAGGGGWRERLAAKQAAEAAAAGGEAPSADANGEKAAAPAQPQVAAPAPAPAPESGKYRPGAFRQTAVTDVAMTPEEIAARETRAPREGREQREEREPREKREPREGRGEGEAAAAAGQGRAGNWGRGPRTEGQEGGERKYQVRPPREGGEGGEGKWQPRQRREGGEGQEGERRERREGEPSEQKWQPRRREGGEGQEGERRERREGEPSEGKWQPRQRREGGEGQEGERRERREGEGGDNKYRPGAYRGRGGGNMGERSGSGRGEPRTGSGRGDGRTGSGRGGGEMGGRSDSRRGSEKPPGERATGSSWR